MDSCRLCENNDKDGDNMCGYGVGMETTIMGWENMCWDRDSFTGNGGNELQLLPVVIKLAVNSRI